MCGAQNPYGGNDLIESLRPALNAIAFLKKLAFDQCQTELQYILDHNVTDSGRIEALFDRLLDFFDDEDFTALFWTLIGYVEQFDTGISAFYRRMEELLQEGE